MAQKSKKQRELNDGLYAGLMEEIKLRLRTIDTILLPDNVLHGTLNRESCYLQLRMCCEALALACLVVHGDITATQTKKFRQPYKADELFKKLKEINPDFYPRSVRQQEDDAGNRHFELFSGPILTKAELIKLYHFCGEVLHRGNLKKLLATDKPLSNSNKDVIGWVEKFWNLLYQHHISLVSGQQIICLLENSSDNNRVQVVRAAPLPQE